MFYIADFDETIKLNIMAIFGKKYSSKYAIPYTNLLTTNVWNHQQSSSSNQGICLSKIRHVFREKQRRHFSCVLKIIKSFFHQR